MIFHYLNTLFRRANYFPTALVKLITVNTFYIDPDYIANVRKQLALDQREAAEIFGAAS